MKKTLLYTKRLTLPVLLTLLLSFKGIESPDKQPSYPPIGIQMHTDLKSDLRFVDEINSLSRKYKKNVEITWPALKVNALQNKYAALLRVMPTAITNLSLYDFVDEWLGVRYRLGGTGRNGIDCSAFVQLLYDEVFGVDLVRTAREQFQHCRLEQNPECLKEGDLVFFKIKSSRISHVGIYLQNNRFVHASSSKGVTISSLDEAYWSRYYAGGGLVREP